MFHFIVRRLMALIPMIFGVSLILFTIVQLTPGGPEMFFASDDSIPDPAQLAAIRRNFGLDDPLHVQYLRWLGNALQGDFGLSFVSTSPVADHITHRLPATIQLTLAATILAIGVGIPFGIMSAVYRYSFLDKGLTFVAFMGISFPAFWLGIMLALVFSTTLGWLPASGISTFGREADFWNRVSHAVLPTITLAAVQLATFLRYTRSSMLETLNQDYVRTARAKGLGERVVLYKHALRNSMIAVVTIMGLQLRSIVAGAALTETVFAWPGLGRLAIQSVTARDYPMIMGINIILAALVIIGNLLVDVAYALIDPRITYS